MELFSYISLFFKGSMVTLTAWMVAATGSLIIGTTAGILSCRHLSSSRSRMIFRVYTFVAKGIPAYVQILIAYFVIPAWLGINVPGFFAATAALAFCSSGYVTEIVRSGINTIAREQWDACFVLGYSTKNALLRIILPQTFNNILPALLGELEQLLKSTSLLATIGITELTRTGMNIISRELNPIPMYLIVACIYLFFSALLNWFVIVMEQRRYHGND